MKSQIVGNRSHLVGKPCAAGCRYPIEGGQVVLVTQFDTHGCYVADPWLVMHVDCVRAKCDKAPDGPGPVTGDTMLVAWRRELIANGAEPLRR